MTTIYLIRHAEAEGNVFRRLQGQYNSNITPNGLRQVAALAERFRDIPIDAVYASDLNRTQITAASIFVPKHLPLHTDPRFREIRCGIWEDTSFGQFDRLDHQSSYDFSHHPHRWHAEGSECFTEYTGRFLRALAEVVRENEGKTVAIFSHGMVLRGVTQTLFFPNNETAVTHCENTAVTRLFWDGEAYQLDFLNDASHLPYEITTVGRQNWWRSDETKDFNLWYRTAEPADAAFLATLGFVPQAGQRVEIGMLGEVPIGAVAMSHFQNDATLDFIGVTEAQRGKGFAPQLLGEVICPLRTLGVARLTAAPTAHPGALRLLERFGFDPRTRSLDIAIDTEKCISSLTFS